MSRKKSLLVIWKILGLFVYTLIADDKYSLLNCGKLRQPIHMQSSKKQKHCSDLFSHCFNSRLNFNRFQTNMNLTADVLTKLRTQKDIVRKKMSKKSRLGRLDNKQHGKRSITMLKYAREHLYQIYWSMWNKLSWKKSLLEIWKNSGLFVNIMSADGKYSVLNRENLTQPIQM